jgi:hypothetical protein
VENDFTNETNDKTLLAHSLYSNPDYAGDYQGKPFTLIYSGIVQKKNLLKVRKCSETRVPLSRSVIGDAIQHS